MALSIIGAEYIATVEATKETVWLQDLVKKLGIAQKTVHIYCESQSVICFVKDPVYHAKTKYIDIRYHKLRKFVASGRIQLVKILTHENGTDMITKPFPTSSSSIIWAWLMLRNAKM